MSRSQQNKVIHQASSENQAYNTDARTSFATAQKDIGSYAGAVGEFKAANPYVQGGQAQTIENQQLSDTASGEAESLGQTVQGAAVRTGQNAGGAIAATEAMREGSMRDLAGQESAATERRLGADTGYREAVLQGTGEVETMQDRLAREQAEAAQGALNTQEQASQTPGFGDVFGNAFGAAAGKFLGGGNLSLSKSV